MEYTYKELKEMYPSLYSRYTAMRARCNKVNGSHYHCYGGRGIKVCEEWNGKVTGFTNFGNWAVKNGFDPSLTLDRIDVNGDYEPSNCRWITNAEQGYNKTNTYYVEYRGRKESLGKLCKEKGLNYQTVYFRINDIGMSPEDALELPVHENVTPFAKKCKAHGLTPKQVRDRINKLGWDEDKAFSTPVQYQSPKKWKHRAGVQSQTFG